MKSPHLWPFSVPSRLPPADLSPLFYTKAGLSEVPSNLPLELQSKHLDRLLLLSARR